MILLIATEATSYFQYNDCDPTCKISNLSCTIEEPEPNYFSNTCEENIQNCKLKASRTVACLIKNRKAVGGQDIWDDYNKNRPQTTTEKPKPQPNEKENCEMYKIVACSSTLISSLMTIYWIATKMYNICKNRSYHPLNDRVSNSPYHETTENILNPQQNE